MFNNRHDTEPKVFISDLLSKNNNAATVKVLRAILDGVIAPGEACDPTLLAEDFWKLYTDRKERR